ncbi:hypothetical protein MHEI_18500 [Mycobacterium heidelbergense]|nr:hypothetical protein MHEI_18500 [Mycobacterium heidelbergense]
MSAPSDGCPPSEAVTTATGVHATYRLARSCGVSLYRAHNLVANSRPARSIDAPEKRWVTTKAMIVSRRRSDRLAAFGAHASRGTRGPAYGVQRAGRRAPEKAQAVKRVPEPDRDKMDFG